MSSNEPQATPPGRILLGGFLMGVANLVPGVSGGTMILAVGLYDRFIDMVARVTRLRWSAEVITFMVLLVAGAGVAVVGLASPAVWLVLEHRWIAYSLFVGMTLGGVPLLWKVVRPMNAASGLAFLVALAGMVFVARGLSNSPLPQTFGVLIFVGALAASSMILPGISGSYVLLIFGLYDVVIGSLRPGDLMEDPMGSLGILVPVGIGVLLGIGLLSNVLKWVLTRFEAPTHAALLGLLIGSVAGLWPFQEAVHPDLVSKKDVKAVVALLDGADADTIEEETGVRLEEADRVRLASAYEGKTKGELKLLGLQLETYTPDVGRGVGALLLLVGGFLFTRRLGKDA